MNWKVKTVLPSFLSFLLTKMDDQRLRSEWLRLDLFYLGSLVFR